MKKQMLMVLLAMGILIGPGGCKKESGYDISDDESKQKGAATYRESVAEYLQKQAEEAERIVREEAERIAREELIAKEWEAEKAENARVEVEKRAARKTRWVVDKPIFGVHLGETLDSLRKRAVVSSSGFVLKDDDHPGIIWEVSSSNVVERLLIRTFDNKIYLIQIQFVDGSKNNYEAIKTQLEKKYNDTDDSLFGGLFGEVDLNVIIDAVKVRINLNHDIGFMEDDKLELIYYHEYLFSQVYRELQKRKADKVSDEL